MHALPETYSFTPQMVLSHVVSIPDASSPPSALVVPAGHEIHALSLTRWFVEHSTFEHVAAVNVPALHDDVPDTVYPGLHVGCHVDQLARELVQSPAPPFVGAAEALQGFVAHVAAVSVPALHDDVPDTVYPELHVKFQTYAEPE